MPHAAACAHLPRHYLSTTLYHEHTPCRAVRPDAMMIFSRPAQSRDDADDAASFDDATFRRAAAHSPIFTCSAADAQLYAIISTSRRAVTGADEKSLFNTPAPDAHAADAGTLCSIGIEMSRTTKPGRSNEPGGELPRPSLAPGRERTMMPFQSSPI